MKGKGRGYWILVLIMALIVAFDLAGCSSGGGGGDTSSGLQPVIDSIEPTSVYQGIDTVRTITIDGANFVATPGVSLIAGDASVRAIDYGAIVLIADMRLTFSIIPANLAVGWYDVKVINPGGKSAVLADAFEISDVAPPTVTSVVPVSGWDQQDTRITITGADFFHTPQVQIGTVPAKNIVLIDSTSISASVPAGMDPNTYDLTVTNPDGRWCTLASAFLVSDTPPPSITGINPEAMTANAGGTLAVYGTGFATGCEAYISDDPNDNRGNFLTVTSFSETELQCTVPGTLGIGVYVVFVFNPDRQYSSYNSLKLGSSADGKLGDTGDFEDSGMNLIFGRRGHAATVGRDDTGNTFIYVAGGSNNTEAFSSVEVSLSGIFGTLSRWRLTKPLNTARTEFGMVTGTDSVGTNYLYAIGGKDTSGTPLASIESARVFTTDTMPQNLTAAHVSEGTLEAGNWIYKVSAVFVDGEGLPSDLASLNTASAGSIQLAWEAVPDALTYNVYRVDQVNGRMGREHLLQEDVYTETFTDDGSYAIVTKSVSDTLTAAASGTSGTMADGTWYYKVTTVTVNGETGPSPAASVTLAAGGSGAVDLSWPAQDGAIYYNVYGTKAPDLTSDDVYLIEEKVLAAAYTDKGSEAITVEGPTDVSGSSISVWGGSLTTDTYYYQVSGLTERGETLPSDEISVAVNNDLNKNAVSLSWNSLPEVISYSVYRSTQTGAEVLIKSDILATRMTDKGLTAGTEPPATGEMMPPEGKMSPVPAGTISDWAILTETLNAARYGHAVAKAEKGGITYVYALCGNNGTDDLITVERTSIDPNSGSLAAWAVETNTVPTARRYLAASVANARNHPSLSEDTAYIYAMQGTSAGGDLNIVDGAEVQSDGSLGTWDITSKDPSNTHYGLSGIVGNGTMYVICGIKNISVSQDVDRGDIGTDGGLTGWSSASAKPTVFRAFQAAVAVNSYLYIISGQTSGANQSTITTTDTVEKIPF